MCAIFAFAPAFDPDLVSPSEAVNDANSFVSDSLVTATLTGSLRANYLANMHEPYRSHPSLLNMGYQYHTTHVEYQAGQQRKYSGTVTGSMNMAGQCGSFLSSVAFGYMVKYFGNYNQPLIPLASALLTYAPQILARPGMAQSSILRQETTPACSPARLSM